MTVTNKVMNFFRYVLKYTRKIITTNTTVDIVLNNNLNYQNFFFYLKILYVYIRVIDYVNKPKNIIHT